MSVDRATGITVPPPPIPPQDKKVRIFVGPVNYAGQGHRWGQAAEENADVASRTMVGLENNAFRYHADYEVRWRTMQHSRQWQRNLVDTLAANYSHVLVEAAMPILGGMFGGNVRRQVALLRSRGLAVGMIGHGTDIRLPSRHRQLERWSYFANDDWVPVAKFEKAVQANLDLITSLNAPTFVSTAGLLLDLPEAHLLPVVIDPDMWATAEPLLERARPKVLHVPSNPQPKGTMHIAPILRRLHDEGVLEYIEVTGRTQAEMPSLYASVDIVLDQFRAGDYGVASCEVMAAGRLVVAHVSDQVRNTVKDDIGLDLPVIEAEIDTIEAVLRDILERREYYREVASHGPAFARFAHDGRRSREVLERHFLLL